MSWYVVKSGVAGPQFKEALTHEFDGCAAHMPIEEEKRALLACRDVALAQVDFFATLNPPHMVHVESSGHANRQGPFGPAQTIDGSAEAKVAVKDMGVFVPPTD